LSLSRFLFQSSTHTALSRALASGDGGIAPADRTTHINR
jgi:hypothetical protein